MGGDDGDDGNVGVVWMLYVVYVLYLFELSVDFVVREDGAWDVVASRSRVVV